MRNLALYTGYLRNNYRVPFTVHKTHGLETANVLKVAFGVQQNKPLSLQ